jgi:hypothetical protein
MGAPSPAGRWGRPRQRRHPDRLAGVIDPGAQHALHGRQRRRLGQDVVHPGIAARRHVVGHHVGGPGHDRDARPPVVGLGPAHRAGELEAVHAGHLAVRENQRVVALLDELERLLAVRGLLGLVAERGDLPGQHGPVELVVVHHQDAPALPGRGTPSAPAARGRSRRSVGFGSRDDVELEAERDGRALAGLARQRQVAVHQLRQAA